MILWILLYIAAGVLIAALAPTIVDLLSSPDRKPTENTDRLGLVALLWPIAAAVVAAVIVIRSMGWLAHNLPRWLGVVAQRIRTESTTWTEPKETPTNGNEDPGGAG